MKNEKDMEAFLFKMVSQTVEYDKSGKTDDEKITITLKGPAAIGARVLRGICNDGMEEKLFELLLSKAISEAAATLIQEMLKNKPAGVAKDIPDWLKGGMKN